MIELITFNESFENGDLDHGRFGINQNFAKARLGRGRFSVERDIRYSITSYL